MKALASCTNMLPPGEDYLSGFNAMQSVEIQPTFQMITYLPSSGLKNKHSKKPASKQVVSRNTCFHASFPTQPVTLLIDIPAHDS
jgi:hypothetical protein